MKKTNMRGNTALHFGEALKLIREGKLVQRTGWNGKNMYLRYYDPFNDHSFPMKERIEREDGVMIPLPWIGMKTADNGFVPWLASQTDILATDWVEVELVEE